MYCNPSRIQVIVPDVDDTLVEGSEDAKDRAWFTVFKEFPPQELEKVIQRAQQKIVGGKGNRKDIARHVLTHFRYVDGQSGLGAEIEKRCDAFDAEVQGAMQKIGVRPKVLEALDTLKDRFPLYINTAIPRAVLDRTLQTLSIGSFFKNIYGTPGTKVKNLERIASNAQVKPDQILFVSDGAGDWKASKEFGCQFIGIVTHRNKWREKPVGERPEILVDHFEEILPMLQV